MTTDPNNPLNITDEDIGKEGRFLFAGNPAVIIGFSRYKNGFVYAAAFKRTYTDGSEDITIWGLADRRITRIHRNSTPGGRCEMPTTTPEYLNEFTADWPHGYVLVSNNGTVYPFVVKVWDWPGNSPIWGHIVGATTHWNFNADGSSDYGLLRDAAPPKRVPEEVWINYYKSGCILVHTSRFDADKEAHSARIKCVRFREVIEGEEAP